MSNAWVFHGGCLASCSNLGGFLVGWYFWASITSYLDKMPMVFQYPGWTRNSLGFLLSGAQHCKINSEIVGSWPVFLGFLQRVPAFLVDQLKGKYDSPRPTLNGGFCVPDSPWTFYSQLTFTLQNSTNKKERKSTHILKTHFSFIFSMGFCQDFAPTLLTGPTPKGALASTWRTIRQREADRWGFDGWRLQRYVKREGNESSLLREKFFEFMWELFFVLKCMLHFGWCFCWLMEIDLIFEESWFVFVYLLPKFVSAFGSSSNVVIVSCTRCRQRTGNGARLGEPGARGSAGIISPYLLEDVVNYRDCCWNIEATWIFQRKYRKIFCFSKRFWVFFKHFW